MDLDRIWKHVVVMGAAGKMGRGIALLLLQEIAKKSSGVLTLLDAESGGFESLKKYLKLNLLKYAERNINQLRVLYRDRKDLIDNEEMILEFVNSGWERTRFVTSLEECREASMVFEAIVEDVEAKSQLLKGMSGIASSDAYYFSNTSSIPIHVLREQSLLPQRLVGLHFYNPPAVQKLLEIILPEGVSEEAKELALLMGTQLQKTIVFSRDIAGFIGNGHFIREIVEASAIVKKLQQKNMPLPQAISKVNAITQFLLLRPMGIFQLIDYVGIDVCQKIAKVMTDYLPGQTFSSWLIDAMIEAGIKGGQEGDGSQKKGFFTYEKGSPSQVYDLDKKEYIVTDAGVKIPDINWKMLVNDKQRKEKMEVYWAKLHTDPSEDGELARHFLEASQAIAHGLVRDHVAASMADVNTVLQNGFFHLITIK